MGNNYWYRTKDLLYYKPTNESFDIHYWTDEDYEEFLKGTIEDQLGQVEQMDQVGIK